MIEHHIKITFQETPLNFNFYCLVPLPGPLKKGDDFYQIQSLDQEKKEAQKVRI